jgi:diacylglycerol O-acyltransferase / trehalose O-mycolyltransferase
MRSAALVAAATVCAVFSAGLMNTAVAGPRAGSGDAAVLLPWSPSTDGSTISSVRHDPGSRTLTLQVYSAAMRKDVEVVVQRAAAGAPSAPTLYLLNGIGGGSDGATWQTKTGAFDFLADKNVNVVQPVGGAGSYYTDWRAADPVLGVNKWKTFLLDELPPLINAALGANKVNVIAAISMAGTSELQLAEADPTMYKSVAVYSGCAKISDPMGHEFLSFTEDQTEHGNLVNMYGQPNDPMWAANDPYIHADRLRGINLFFSSGTGLPGAYDRLPAEDIANVNDLERRYSVGGALEVAVNVCTHQTRDRLNSLGIPATYDFYPQGTHAWAYWNDAFLRSWPVLAKGLGLPR